MPKTQAMYLVPKELLGDLTPEELRHLKRRVVAANKAMGYWYQQIGRDCTSMTSGHVSARVPGTNTFITKGRAPDRDMMSEVTLQKIVQVDISAREKVAGEMEVAPLGEIELHSCVYEARPDVVSVCHAHSDYIILCGLFGLNLNFLPLSGGPRWSEYGVYDKFYRIASPETGIPMAKALGDHNICLLVGHGATVASTRGPEECINRLMNLEELCKITWLAFSAVGKDYEKYGISDATYEEGRKVGANARMHDRYDTPGKNMGMDKCYYNAAMVKTYREAVEG
ncbi:class II aldolase/adducin family protein [Chloroflexota bacterium]